MAHGTVSETYHAALAHGFAEIPEGATRVGVVRRPMAWFRGEIDENVPELSPPEEFLEEFKQRHEDLKMRGMCDEGAHNAAWEELRFEEQYREYLADSTAAESALSGLAERIESGEDLVLVCFEADNKQCHRHALLNEVEGRVSPDA
jgi:uncharacterized protein YeaO (DUF488 family)